jgi:hypothetical protein
MTATEDFNAAVGATEDWINDLVQRLGWRDREHAYRALIAALHAMRDCLARDEAIYLIYQTAWITMGGIYFTKHLMNHV